MTRMRMMMCQEGKMSQKGKMEQAMRTRPRSERRSYKTKGKHRRSIFSEERSYEIKRLDINLEEYY
jgi:hypothetical protein